MVGVSAVGDIVIRSYLRNRQTHIIRYTHITTLHVVTMKKKQNLFLTGRFIVGTFDGSHQGASNAGESASNKFQAWDTLNQSLDVGRRYY